MHVTRRNRWLVLPTALSLCSAVLAQPQQGAARQPPVTPPPQANPPAPVRAQTPPVATTPQRPAFAVPPSLYKGMPLPADGEILEIPTGAKDRYTVAPYRFVAEPYSNRKEVADVELTAVNDERVASDMPQIITVSALAQGEATLVLPLVDPQTGTVFERRITVLVVDQISPAFREYMKANIKRLFPSVSVDIVVANGRTVLLSGYVDRAELVEVLVDFVRSSLNNVQRANGTAGGAVEVVNALRVVDAMQVQLKVVFATVNRTKLRELGLSWTWEDLSGPLTGGLSVQLPGNPGPAATVPFFVTRAGSFSYLGFLQALQTQGLGKVLAEPTLTAMSGTPAFFNAGQNFPIVSPGATVLGGGANGGQVGGGSVTFVPIGTNLRYVPTVLGNGRIRLEVRPEVSEFVRDVPTPGGGTAPVTSQRVAETTVELESGQTFVLAGLTRQQTAVSVSKLPFIADIPLVGWAFQQKSYQQQEEELIIMVTPYFADALNQAPCKLPGRESRIPNDVEFYFGSKFEPPCFHDPYVGDWRKDWRPPVVLPVPPYDNRGLPDTSLLYPHEHVKQVHRVGMVQPAVVGPTLLAPPEGSSPPSVAPPAHPDPQAPPPAEWVPTKPGKKAVPTPEGVKKTSAMVPDRNASSVDGLDMPMPSMNIGLPTLPQNEGASAAAAARVERKGGTDSVEGAGRAGASNTGKTGGKPSTTGRSGGKILSLIPKDSTGQAEGEGRSDFARPADWRSSGK